ncbi:unnamed protein product [Prunus brigantina]
MHTGPRDASDSMQASTHRFFGCLWLGTCFQQLCLRSLPISLHVTSVLNKSWGFC